MRGALCRARGALVGRYCLHLTDHAFLPVGRTCAALVRLAKPAGAAPHLARTIMAARRYLV